MRDWKLIAQGLGLDIPDGELEIMRPTLDRLEEKFRPLAAAIPHDMEPAVVFPPPEENR